MLIIFNIWHKHHGGELSNRKYSLNIFSPRTFSLNLLRSVLLGVTVILPVSVNVWFLIVPLR